MLHLNENRPLKEMIPDMLVYIENNIDYLECNEESLEIYEGDLKSRVLGIMKNSLSDNYYNKVKHRVVPINFLPKIIDKLAKVYMTEPKRKCSNDPFLDHYERVLSLNSQLNLADEYANLHKGYALEPFIDHKGKPQLKVLPFDKFLVMGTDHRDRRRMTIFIKFMGTRNKIIKDDRTQKEKVVNVDWFIAYSDKEIVAFDRDSDHMPEITAKINGINPIGRIPFVYGNRSRQRLLPLQDTDIIQLTTILPVILSDLAGAIMFQCFTIIYGIDLNAGDLDMNPNAFWDFKSDKKTDKQPQIGTIKPEVDTDKVLKFFVTVLSSWLESKSIKVGSMGSTDAESFASGVAKIIDEMDTFEVRKRSVEFFQHEERDMWDLLGRLNNHWNRSGEVAPEYIFPNVDVDEINRSLSIDFDPPRPNTNRKEVAETVILEINSGLTTRKEGVTRLNPHLDEDDINSLMGEIDADFVGVEPVVENEEIDEEIKESE